MSETVAVALISALPTAAVAIAALVGNFLLDRRRHTHEQKQLVQQLRHERDMRLLEWRRQDRLERLAPVRAFLDAAGREAVGLGLYENIDEVPLERFDRVTKLMEEQGHAVLLSADERLSLLFRELLTAMQSLIQSKPGDDRRPLREQVARCARKAWDRLEELKTDL